MPLYAYQSTCPEIAEDVWIAPDANVIGNVRIGKGSSIWFSCLVRGDVHSISVGEYTNVQDISVLHVTIGKFPLSIGSHCTLGHRVTVHGCSLADYSFVGMGATVLDGCELGEFSILGAGSVLPPGKKVSPRTLALGCPAKEIRSITAEEENMIVKSAEGYYNLQQSYKCSGAFSLIGEPVKSRHVASDGSLL